jgi:lipopolysaccharide/colanic/teichoic acid biosynthesis glycosyltransferase
VTTNRQRGLYLVIKRLTDVLGAAVLLVLLAPLYVVVAAAIKLDSPGPVLYRGRRVGKDRAEFFVMKFRTMYDGVPDDRHRDFVKNLLREGATGPGTMYKLVDDDRVTRVGRLLRRWSIDEIPQLLNVIRGEMSLVGPRPEVPYVLDDYADDDFKRFDVLPGMTGLWQVEGRANLSPRDMLDLDRRYAETCTLRLDVLLLIRTIPAVIARVGSA